MKFPFLDATDHGQEPGHSCRSIRCPRAPQEGLERLVKRIQTAGGFSTLHSSQKLKVCRFCQDSILPGQELLTSFGIGLPWHGDLSSHLCINVVYHTGLVNRPEMIQRNCYPGSNGKVTIYIQTYFLLMPTKCHFSLTLRIVLGWQERYCVERVTWGFNK